MGPGKVLFSSWTWAILLILAAYTASLTTHLLAEVEAPPPFQTLREAITQAKTICAINGTSTVAFVERSYPNYAHIIKTSNLKEAADALASKKCDAAVVAMLEYEQIKHMPALAKRCSFYLVEQDLAER